MRRTREPEDEGKRRIIMGPLSVPGGRVGRRPERHTGNLIGRVSGTGFKPTDDLTRVHRSFGAMPGMHIVKAEPRESLVLGSRVLDARLASLFLEWLDATDLLSAGCASRALHVLCNEEPLWMVLCIRRYGGSFLRCGTWKATFQWLAFGVGARTVRHPCIHAKIESTYLSNRWLRCNANLKGFYPNIELVERVQAPDIRIREQSAFYLEFDAPRKPVSITGAIENWPCRETWSISTLAARFGQRIKWQISHLLPSGVADGRLEMTMQDYAHYLAHQRDEVPLYIFDSHFGENAPELLQEYDPTVGGLFPDDLLAALPAKQRPPYRWLVVGPERTGASWHVDPSGTSAWNALVDGEKRWAFYPPGVIPPGVQADFAGPDREDSAAAAAVFTDADGVPCLRRNDHELLSFESMDSLKWYLEVYPTLEPNERPMEIIQRPGDVIFVPSGWWHAVINLSETVSVTHNFCNPANFRAVVHEMVEQRSGFLDAFRLGLSQMGRQDMVRRLDLIAQAYDSGESEIEYALSFRDVDRWIPILERILRHHRLPNACNDWQCLTKRFNPVFLHTESECLIKMYSHFLAGDIGFGAHSFEPAVRIDGAHAACVEATMLESLNKFEPDLAPKLLAFGVYYGLGHENHWKWPYLVSRRVRGKSLAAERKNISAQIVAQLGFMLRRVHSLGRRDPHLVQKLRHARGAHANSFRAQLLRQAKYAPSAHLRKATLPRHLLFQINAFVQRWLHVLLERLDSFAAVLHGDLQEENILVINDSDEENNDQKSSGTRSFLTCIWGSGDAISSLVDKLVKDDLLCMESLGHLTEHDLIQCGIPLGPRRLLQAALKNKQVKSLVPQSSSSHLRLAGLIDFGDSVVGDPIYDMVALFASALFCDKAFLRTFLTAYGDGNSSFLQVLGVSREEFGCIAMCYMLLHPCDALSRAHSIHPQIFTSCKNWEQVAYDLWVV